MNKVPTADTSPLVIVWRVVESCSLACQFCGYSRDLPVVRRHGDLQRIRAFGQVLRDSQRLLGRSILVSWLGGEPLAWSPLLDLSRYFHQVCGLRLGVTTNGLPLASEMVREGLLRSFEQVTVSIDGQAEFHDAVRGQAGLYVALREHVSQLRRQDVNGRLLLRVNTVLMRDNIGQFPAFCEEMVAWGFRELSFNQLGGNERPDFFAVNHLLPAQFQRFADELPELRARMAARGLVICGSEAYLERIAATTARQPIPIDDCLPGTEFLFIDAMERVSPCSFTIDEYGVPLETVSSPEKFLALPSVFHELRRRSRANACADCHATHVFAKFKRQDACSDATVM